MLGQTPIESSWLKEASMAKSADAPAPAQRSGRTVVPLRTSKGTLRVTLPRPGAAGPGERRPAAGEVLAESLEDRWKKFRRRLRKGVPDANRKSIDESVHDLRVSARRLLSVLEAMEPLVGGKASRRLSRRVDAILERLGPLRDSGVQLETISKITAPASAPALAPVKQQLIRKHGRQVRKLRARLSREDVGRLKDDVRRLLERSRRAEESSTPSAIRRAALQPLREAFGRLHESRLAVDPTDLETIHRMRIALKKSRYLMETLRPLTPAVGEKELESLHKLQTTMGDLHDLEVLSSRIARHVEKLAPENAARLAPVLGDLEKRHSSMLTSFLEGVDPILEPWNRLMARSRA